ncbi:MAG TPA: helix-turn-helix domain-containing protein [Sphingomonas sp.]|nr:helix-turn-helix domain-containing protein [Sphingomonas sp.]
MRDSTKIPPRPRGRPRKFDEAAVLRAAFERFRAQGFSSTSLDDLAEATGVNRPSLYAAFGDKKALYLAAAARVREGAERRFDTLIAADLPMEQMLKALFLNAIEGYLTGEDGPAGCIMINTAATEAVTDPDIRAALQAFLAMEDAKVETLLRQAGSPAPAAHARIVAALLHSLSVRARAGEPRAALIALAKDTTALILGTLA